MSHTIAPSLCKSCDACRADIIRGFLVGQVQVCADCAYELAMLVKSEYGFEAQHKSMQQDLEKLRSRISYLEMPRLGDSE